MKFIHWLFVIIWYSQNISYSQNIYTLSGQVTGENKSPLPGANVVINSGQRGTVTDKNGNFTITGLGSGKYFIEISFMGYEKLHDTLRIISDRHLQVNLKSMPQTLEEVAVVSEYAGLLKKDDPRSIEVVNDKYIKNNISGSLMGSLERLPGVSTIEIGSGQSKPVIRGLSFNRVIVAENGIKHESQQWGADHGLEIDQYAIDRVEIIKGLASLMYGSDAMGGIIDLKQTNIPPENMVGGIVDLAGRSNNKLAGTSANIYARRKSFYVSARFTLVNYADYRVPADSVEIYSYRAPLYKNRLRNTAGNEQDIHLSFGNIGKYISNRVYISNLKSKAGFFANAHGLEPRRVDTQLHDKSDRDIQYPFQEVDHLKIIWKSNIKSGMHNIETVLGYQNNFRQEWSRYVAHGFMPAILPDSLLFPADLEFQFNKDVYSGNLKDIYTFSDRITVTTGISSEYQNNRIGGRGFVIPAFVQYSAGAFVYSKFRFSERAILHSGLRYDYGSIRIKEYKDWFESVVISSAGDTTGYEFLQRSPDLSRKFNSICWSFGVNYKKQVFNLKANIGKSYRMPIAKELAANGVNYHHFSYEVGNPELSAEVSYQFDLGLEWNYTRFVLGISPFFNYFPNYIYLNPSYKHDYLYGAGNQVYYYTQAGVLRFGGEIHLHYNILKQFKTGLIGEYVYSEQLSGEKKGFTLPFSPPLNVLFNLRYSPVIIKALNEPYISVDYRLTAAQNKIVPPERKTDGSQIINISIGSQFKWEKQFISISIQVQNLFNSNYYNHTSYYRIINVPEAGRNFIINLSIPFEHQTVKHKQTIK